MPRGQVMLDWIITWIDPWLWISTAVILFVFVLVGAKPMQEPEDAGLKALVLIKLRWTLLWGLFCLYIALPAFYFCMALTVFGTAWEPFINASLNLFFESFTHYWTVVVLGFVLANALVLFWYRAIIPKVSALLRKFRVKQSGEELSDIRVEIDKLNSKQFCPKDYYKLDQDLIFMGLDAKGKPAYMEKDWWQKRHQRSIGPTQIGKGVHIGVQIDQAIRLGMTVFAIDPKPDDFMRDIMNQACEETGRRLISVDLNPGKQGRYAPFVGGTARFRRQRLVEAMGLVDTGQQADFYKTTQRGIIDKIFNQWDGTLDHLEKILKAPEYYEDCKKILSYISEWKQIDTFTPPKGRGLDIARSIEENAVVYVRASVDDDLVIKGGTLLIQELVQEVKRLPNEGKKTDHLFLVIDEVKFMISDVLAKAVATILSKGVNMLIAYQTVEDPLSLPDKTLDGRTIKSAIDNNFKISLIYQAQDPETAEWAAAKTGTQQKAVTRMEAVEVGRYGAEQWNDHRMLNRVEENLIHPNTFMALPDRVGALLAPNQLAHLLYTCWILVEKPFIEQAKPAKTQQKKSKNAKASPKTEKPKNTENIEKNKVEKKIEKNDSKPDNRPNKKIVAWDDI